MTEAAEQFKDYTPQDFGNGSLNLGLVDAVKCLGDENEPIEFTAFERIHAGVTGQYSSNSHVEDFVESLVIKRGGYDLDKQQTQRNLAFGTMMTHACRLYVEYPESSDEIIGRIGAWHAAFEPDVRLDDVLESFSLARQSQVSRSVV